MNEAMIRKIIREMIQLELAPILMASVVSNTDQNRAVIRRFSSEGPIPNLRSIQPFGISSRAPAGTQGLVIPVNGDPTHLNLVGHFDTAKPACDDGETVLYGADGQVIYLKSGGTIHQGTEAADEPVVLGTVLQTFADNLLESFLQTGIVGYDSFGLPVYLSPDIAETMTTEKANHVDNPDTNFLAQKNFVERGE